MEIKGKVIQVNSLVTGQGANGEWKKQEFIIETEGDYPKKVCICAWGDKIAEFALKEGETVNVSVNVESREYNSRWYTDVKAWKVEKLPTTSANNAPAEQAEDDLPF